jgi:hypothetical protein
MGLYVDLGLKWIRLVRLYYTFNALLVYLALVNRSLEPCINPLRLSYNARCVKWVAI